MRTASLLLAFALLPGSASPQTSGRQAPDASPSAQSGDTQATTAAVASMLRGDYARAAELLEPQVANWQYADATAAFFLGLLYENGLGVPLDKSRACALFARGSEGPGPFTQSARELTSIHLDMSGPDPVLDCRILMNWGLRHGFAPARFNLASDHWVAIDISPRKRQIVAIVGYRGREKESAFSYGPSMGAVYLPASFTSLPGKGEGAPARHFVEVSHWLPVGPSQWQLLWSLAEVGDGDIVEVANKTLTTVESQVPPFDVTLELRELVDLRLTDAGGIEIVIRNGPEPPEDVPTFAERKEMREETARRKAADEKVNWKRRRDPARSPSFAYGETDGCGDLFVYGLSPGRAEAIAIRAGRRALDLSVTARTFDLSVPDAELEVLADVYEYPQREWYCSNPSVSDAPPSTWRAVGGTVTIQLAAPSPLQRSRGYQATIQLDNVEFVSPTGITVRSPGSIRLTAPAGHRGGVDEVDGSFALTAPDRKP